METLTETEHLILSELTSAGLPNKGNRSKKHVTETDSDSINHLTSILPNLAKTGQMQEHSAEELQGIINCVLEDGYPLGVVIYALYKMKLPYERYGEVGLYFYVNSEMMEKYFFSKMRSLLGCNCKSPVNKNRKTLLRF